MSDNISRQAALEALCNVCDKNCNKSEFVYNAPQAEQVILCPEHYALCNLQPAQQEQRTGEYVHVSGYDDQYKCTACGIDIVPMRVVKFCPECGAKILKMISGERVRYPWEGAKV